MCEREAVDHGMTVPWPLNIVIEQSNNLPSENVTTLAVVRWQVHTPSLRPLSVCSVVSIHTIKVFIVPGHALSFLQCMFSSKYNMCPLISLTDMASKCFFGWTGLGCFHC